MRFFGLVGLLVAFSLSGCAAQIDTAKAAPLDSAAAAVGAAKCAAQRKELSPVTPSGRPADARTDLGLKWVTADHRYAWPPHDGFDRQAVAQILTPGMLLDRFGSDCGNFFSPKGARFQKRALATVCADQPYTVYRVTAPLFVWAGTAAEWFDQTGGATQFETDAPVYLLVADHVLEPVPYAGAKPCEG